MNQGDVQLLRHKLLSLEDQRELFPKGCKCLIVRDVATWMNGYECYIVNNQEVSRADENLIAFKVQLKHSGSVHVCYHTELIGLEITNIKQ